MPVELTDAQFEIFKKEAQHWVDKFGLKDWELLFSFGHNDDFDRARCYMNWTNRICTLELARWQSAELSNWEIKTLAFHEVCELLLADMEHFAMFDGTDGDRNGHFEAAKHSAIRRLENYFFS